MADTALDTNNPPSDPPPSDPPTEPPGGNEPPSEPPSEPPKAAWGEDWREQLAGDDDKVLGRLKRYGTLNDFAKAGFEAQDTIRTTRSSALPEDATPEQLTAWREENGIPAEAKGYEVALEDGLVIGENDQPMVDAFLEAMHGENAPPGTVNAAMNAYYKIQAESIAAIEAEDGQLRGETIGALKDEWGPDYQSNHNAVVALMNTLPESVKELMENARLQDGTAMLNSPDVMKWMSDLSRKTNPAATVVPGGGDVVQTIADEVKKIEGMMGTDAYVKDEKLQARLRELYRAQEGMAKNDK